MRAIIPVAGLGTRLRPHTNTLPKVMLNVGGKPIIGHILDKLIHEDITKATFIYGHLGEKVMQYVEKEYPQMHADFILQESLEGLGHAIYTAIPTFDEDKLLIILGDTIFDVDLHTVMNEKYSSLGVKYVEDPSRFGVAILENGFVKQLVEKPQTLISNLALVGLYYINNKNLLIECLKELVNKNIRTRGELQLTDALQLMLERGEKMTTFPVEGWYDCGKPETLLSTNKFLLQQKKQNIQIAGCSIIPPVYIDSSAVIKNSIIGPFTTIGKDSFIDTCILSNCIVGNQSNIEKTILKDSIIGNSSNIRGYAKKLNTGDSTEIEFY